MIVPRVFKSRQRKRKNISIVLSSQKKHKDFSFVLFLFVYMNLFGETRTLRPSFCKNSLPCKGRWASLRQAGGIFSKNRFQKESASLFNPSVIFDDSSLYKGA